MNKRELGDAVAGAFGGNKAMGGAAVDAVVDAIAAALAKGEKISFAGVGNFEVRNRPARSGGILALASRCRSKPARPPPSRRPRV
jgi:DNA-binding protein HU-beta